LILVSSTDAQRSSDMANVILRVPAVKTRTGL
jgi:hypothetical protein